MMKTTVIAMLVAAFAAGAMAQVAGTIITPEGRKIEGTIRWNPRDKAYAIIQKGGGNIELSMTKDKVRDLNIPQPKELAGAIEAVTRGNGAAAIDPLKKVVKNYQMLKWDVVATRYLAQAYLLDGNADKALSVCESVIKEDPEAAYLGEVAPVYWEALIKKDRVSKVEGLLTKAIQSGDRTASAFAQIRRGDLILAAGETPDNAKKALRDGYLRVVTLYRGIRDAQPEALYKAAKCFDKLGQANRADAMRSTLKGQFAGSEWAKK